MDRGNRLIRLLIRGYTVENPILNLGQFTEVELIEIFASAWLGMDLDFKSFTFMREEQRKDDGERFAQLNGVRYSVLSKIAKRFKGTDKHADMQEILDSAGEIMLVARGGTG